MPRRTASSRGLDLAFQIVALLAPATLPLAVVAAQFEPCDLLRARVGLAATERGYRVTELPPDLQAEDGAIELELRCAAESAVVALHSAGVRVDLALELDASVWALELFADFPDVGWVSHRAVVHAVDGADVSGFLQYTAEVAGQLAFVEFGDFAGGDPVVGGDPVAVSAAFAEVLSAAQIWHDAHVMAFAMAGLYDLSHEISDEIGRMLEGEAVALALPAPGVPATDQDGKKIPYACGGALVSCGAALILKGALGSGGACIGGSSACLAAVGCTLADCEGDDEHDYDTTTG